jgi:hypothetical protein
VGRLGAGELFWADWNISIDITGGATPVKVVLDCRAWRGEFSCNRDLQDDTVFRRAYVCGDGADGGWYAIAEQQGIHLEEPPIVNHLDLRNGGRHR